LGIFFHGLEHLKWEDLLNDLLTGNSWLNELEVSVSYDSIFSHSFLGQALNLTSYSFKGNRVSSLHLNSLLNFIANHKRLQYLYLTFNDWKEVSADSFIEFYEKLVVAIQANLSIKHIEWLIPEEHRHKLDDKDWTYFELEHPSHRQIIVLNGNIDLSEKEDYYDHLVDIIIQKI
jgi:hypothetical protein